MGDEIEDARGAGITKSLRGNGFPIDQEVYGVYQQF